MNDECEAGADPEPESTAERAPDPSPDAAPEPARRIGERPEDSRPALEASGAAADFREALRWLSTPGSEPSQQGRDVLAMLYTEIHQLARTKVGRSADHSLQTTDLVNELLLKFMQAGNVQCGDRNQFRALVVRVLRQVLIDHARAKKRLKRDPGGVRVPLDAIQLSFEETALDLLALDEAMSELEKMDPQAAQVVELRFFGDLTTREIADLQKRCARSVERDWAITRAWLRKRMQ